MTTPTTTTRTREGAQPTADQEAMNLAAARGSAPKKAQAAKPKAETKKARTAAPPQAKPKVAAKAEHPVKKAARAAANAIAPTPKMRKPRAGKTQTMITMMSRPKGATMKELIKVSGWNEQSLKWFMASTLGKKKGIKVEHDGDGDKRVYRIPATAAAPADPPEAV